MQSPWWPAGARPVGAIGVVQLRAESGAALDALFDRLGWRAPAVGVVSLVRLGDVDTAPIARPAPGQAFITPHGSPLIVDRLVEALESAGGVRAGEGDPRSAYPEAPTLADAAALDAISTAASPLAIDFILEHRDRWRRSPDGPADPALGPLDRLLTPPTVVLVGAPNIGKSTLTNAMAQRDVAIVHDEPGVTRDHVGVAMTLAGVTVRWIDTPGLHDAADPIDRAAIDAALPVIQAADCLLVCADPGSVFPDLASVGVEPAGSMIRVGLRTDLGPVDGADVATAAIERAGLDDLAGAIVGALIPAGVRDGVGLWRYHPALGAGSG